MQLKNNLLKQFLNVFNNLHSNELFTKNSYRKIMMMTMTMAVSILSTNLLKNPLLTRLFSLSGLSSVLMLSLIILANFCNTVGGMISSIVGVILLNYNMLPNFVRKLFCRNNKKYLNCKKYKKKSDKQEKNVKHKKHNKSKTYHLDTSKLLKICDNYKKINIDHCNYQQILHDYTL
jgi:uncharacterized protein YacL